MSCRFLAMLVVDGAVWKRGIGRKLVQWGLDQAQQDALGPADVYLTASLLGEAFYWKLGFRTLGWDYVKDVDAPDGVCKWPFMIKRGKSVKVAPSSVTISPVVRPEDCKKIIKVHAASFAVDSYTPTSRLRNPPVSQEVKERQLQGQCRHMSKQVQEGTGSKYIKAEIDNVIVGYAEWIPRGEDTMEPLSGPDLTFNMRYVGQVIRTRRRVMEGKRYWYLICLAVDPAYFGGGIGRRLVQWGIDEAKKDDSDCYLETMLKNEAFYSKLGFKTIGWESIEAPEAPEGVCEWIYMIRKGRKGG
jgi:predicted N-acetyltransferase YhbS